MATADLTVIALGRPDASASAYIAAIQRRLAAQTRVGYRMHAMGTSLEGTTEDILAVVGELHAVPFELGVPHADPQRGAIKLMSALSRADFPRSDLKIDRRGLITVIERKG